jgi:hypothetical protein
MRPLLNQAQQAVVDGSGRAVVLFSPHGENWEVTRLTVAVTTAVNESEARYYIGPISDQNLQEGTQAGSTGDTTDVATTLVDGDQFWVEWTGADVGAVATATLRGWRSVPAGGFRAMGR